MPDAQRATDLVVIATGARTPVGFGALSSVASVRAGISRIHEHPIMLDKSGDPFMVAMDRTLGDPARTDRIFALAASALDEVLESLPVSAGTRVPIYLGLPERGGPFTDDDASELCMRLERHLHTKCHASVTGITEGNAAGVIALEQAIEATVRDPNSFVIVGGVDSLIDADVLEPLDEAGRIASQSNRWGFPPGEGACMLAVARKGFARDHRLMIQATIAAIASSHEPNRISTRTVCVGVGLAESLRKVVEGAAGPIGKQYCDLNGERYREHEFSYAVLRIAPSKFVNALDYVAPADCWGHTGAATAPLLLLLPIVGSHRGSNPGAWPMMWCGSDSGRRGAVLLHLNQGGAS